MLTIPAGQRNCNQTDSKPIFLLLDRKKEDPAFKTNSARLKINTTFANTDNKGNLFVMVFAFNHCSQDKILPGDKTRTAPLLLTN